MIESLIESLGPAITSILSAVQALEGKHLQFGGFSSALISFLYPSLIAIMLGRLKMTTTEAIAQYIRITERVFASSNKKRMAQDGTFKATTLEVEIKAMVAEKDGNDGDRMISSKDSTTFAWVLL